MYNLFDSLTFKLKGGVKIFFKKRLLFLDPPSPPVLGSSGSWARPYENVRPYMAC